MTVQAAKPEPEPITTRSGLIRMYGAYPPALEAELALALMPVQNEAERGVHNCAVQRIMRLIPTEQAQRLLWTNLARAIIETAIHQGADNGKEHRTKNDS